MITAEFADYYVVTCYTPNSQSELGETFLPDDIGRTRF